MKMPKIIANHRIVASLLVLVVVAVPPVYYYRGRTPEVKYTMAPVRRGSITAVVQATGSVNPLTTVPVGSFISGTVLYVFADFNTRVHANQVLAQLDPSYYEAQYTTARGNLNNALANQQNAEANIHTMEATIQADLANVARLQADADYQRANARRAHDLATQGVFSKEQDDLAASQLAQAEASLRQSQAQVTQARSQLEQIKAQLNQAKAQVEANRGSLSQAETNLRYSTIISPIEGIVIARNITVGQSVAASLQAPNVFTIAQDLKRMQVYAKTDESDTGNIHVGAEVTFQVDAFPNEQFHGRVSTVRLNASVVQNVVTYDTVIDFENPDEKIKPSETAYVTIPTGQVENVIVIPNAALSFVPDMAFTELRQLYTDNKIRRAAYSNHLGGWQVVWTRTPEGKLKPIEVRTGITDYVNTQMIEGNIKENDQLITFAEGGKGPAATGASPFGGGQGGRGPGGPGGGGGRGGGR